MSELEEQRERARAAREALLGKTIAGKYLLRALIGHGGMGAVYEAENVGIGKRFAIKFVDPEFATDEQVVSRFAREARAMSAIESAHIVTVFDAGAEDGRPYLVMELLRGEDLGERLRRTRTVPVKEAMHIIAQVLKGLSRAHAAGIVHRDLKPDNVFLTNDDHDALFVKIVDFGVSKIARPRSNTAPMALTGRGTVLGTPLYMSPEQAQCSADVDARADLYSVGAILFECLTGRPPHVGESYEQVILSICMNDAPDVRTIVPSTPDDVAGLVARALARDPSKRFASAEEMLAVLHEVASDEKKKVPLDSARMTLVSAASAESPPEKPIVVTEAPPAPKQKSVVLAAVIATALGVVVTFGIIHALEKPPPDPEPVSVPAPPAPPTVTSASAAHAEPVPVAIESAAPAVVAPEPSAKPTPKAMPKLPAPAASAIPKTVKSLDIQRDLP